MYHDYERTLVSAINKNDYCKISNLLARNELHPNDIKKAFLYGIERNKNVQYQIMNNYDMSSVYNKALLLCVEYDRKHVAQILINKGAEFRFNDDQCILYAAELGKLETLKVLLNHTQTSGYHYAYNMIDQELLNRILIAASLSGQLNVIKYILKEGADIHADNDKALEFAKRSGNAELFKYLIDMGGGNEQLILNAAMDGDLETLEMMIDPIRDVFSNKIRDKNLLNNILKFACIADKLNIVKYILSQGADIDTVYDGIYVQFEVSFEISDFIVDNYYYFHKKKVNRRFNMDFNYF